MPFDFASPEKLSEAAGLLSKRTPIGSILRTAEWERLPLALRQRAQFSSGVESMRVLQAIQDKLMEAVTNARKEESVSRGTGEPGAFKMNRQKFIADIREIAIQEGLAPTDEGIEGTLQDITSEARLDLIFRTQEAQAHGFAFWKRGQSQNILDAWPAYELVRVAPRKVPRDWERRWAEAGGSLVEGGRMAALKTDPVWTKLSRFGTPWPPFDFNSGMGVMERDREQAVAWGLLAADEQMEPIEADFNAGLEASAKGIDPRTLGAMKTIFGDQIEVDGEAVRWKEAA